jgi:hypothetical protein
MPARRLLYWTSPPTGGQGEISLDVINLRDGEAPCVITVDSTDFQSGVVALVNVSPIAKRAAFVYTSTSFLDLAAPAPALGGSLPIADKPIELWSELGSYEYDLDQVLSLFSPDGNWLIESNGAVLHGVAIGTDGTPGPLQQLISASSRSVWAPTGDRLVVGLLQNPGTQMKVYDPTTGTITAWQLDAGSIPSLFPWWSPDGRWIAIQTFGTTNPGPGQVMLADTAHPERGLIPAGPVGDNQTQPLDWSPDSSNLAVWIDGAVHVIAVGDGAPVDRFQVPASNSYARFVVDDDHVATETSSTTSAVSDSAGGTRTLSTTGAGFMVSPDRRTIAVIDWGHSVVSVDAATGTATTTQCAAGNIGYEQDAAWAWSPSGTSFACVSRGSTQIHLFSLATGADHVVDLAQAGAAAGDVGGYSRAQYSPDGATILFARGTEAFVVDAGGSNAHPIPTPNGQSFTWAVQ